MADLRFGNVYVPGTTDIRFGLVAYSDLGTKAVSSSEGVAGTAAHTVLLAGTWDAGSKTAVLTDANDADVSLTLTDEDATSIEFTVPAPYDNGSPFHLFNLDTQYTITVDDSGAPVEGLFTITAPSGAQYWYIPTVTGGPDWNEGSIFCQSSNLSNGDSAFVRVLSGGPLTSLNSDGSWIAEDSLTFDGKGYNSTSGWSLDWSDFAFNAVGELLTVEETAERSRGSGGRRSADDEHARITQEDSVILNAITKFLNAA